MKNSRPDEQLTIAFESNGVVTHEPISLQTPSTAEYSSAGIVDIGSAQFEPVGVCIYCGTTNNLGREHIVPFGLSGNAVLNAASCKSCATVTSKFEMHVLRGAMRDVRVLRKLRSRSKHANARRTFPLKIRRNDCVETVELSLEEYPILLHFATFTLPGTLTGHDRTGIQMTGVATVQFGPLPQTVGRALGAQEIVLDAQPDHPIAFARMIGKIGYAMAVAQGAIDPRQGRPEIVASILGEIDEIGQWVGTRPSPF